jgi:hypothetical protein
LKAKSTDEVRYSSKEGTTPPQLVIQQELPPPPPTIASLLPSSGSVGAEIMIEGANFVDVTAVKFNGTPAASFTVPAPTMIHAVVPAGATSGKVSVTTDAGAATSADDFTVILPPAPAISSFTPASGPVGTQVTLRGGQFVNVTAVKFNGVAASKITVDSEAQIRAIVPAGATSGKISVITDAGTATSATNFTVTAAAPAPTIASFAPTSGPVGTEVVIRGSNFVNVTGVKFNGVSASSFTIDSATQIRAVVPTGASVGKISVSTATGMAPSTINFEVITTAPPKYQVFLPLLRTGAATTSAGVRTLSGATAGAWHTSVPFGYCPLRFS